MKIKPIGDRVVVEVGESQDEKKGGIFIPEMAKEKPMEAVVVAVGKSKDMCVKKGDVVLMPKFGGTEVRVDGKGYQIIKEGDILAVIE